MESRNTRQPIAKAGGQQEAASKNNNKITTFFKKNANQLQSTKGDITTSGAGTTEVAPQASPPKASTLGGESVEAEVVKNASSKHLLEQAQSESPKKVIESSPSKANARQGSR
jgi:hypothetical protein